MENYDKYSFVFFVIFFPIFQEAVSYTLYPLSSVESFQIKHPVRAVRHLGQGSSIYRNILK